MNCLDLISSNLKKIGLLIDPDKYNRAHLTEACKMANNAGVDFILIGGSVVSTRLDEHIDIIKAYTKIPVILFPGNLLQLTKKADAMLLLSLISGRNPEYLVGNHILAAPFIKGSGMECIPTAYVLIDGGRVSAVEYVSNTQPIPQNKTDIIIATCIAGELMGNKLVYLETGSGAKNTVSCKIVEEVAKNINIPIIVGGGVRTNAQATELLNAGANMVVVGNAIENNLGLISQIKGGAQF